MRIFSALLNMDAEHPESNVKKEAANDSGRVPSVGGFKPASGVTVGMLLSDTGPKVGGMIQ